MPVTPRKPNASNETLAKFFVFEQCIIYTLVVKQDLYHYENFFWVKNVKFVGGQENAVAELKNRNQTVRVENLEMIEILREQKKRQKNHEENAEIVMETGELVVLIDL